MERNPCADLVSPNDANGQQSIRCAPSFLRTPGAQPGDHRPPIRFKRLHEEAIEPAYQSPGAAGFDLSVIEKVVVPPRSTVMARTGLVIAAPRGHMLMLAPRSSTWKRYKVRLANTVGIVDADFSGDEDEILLALWNPLVDKAKVEAGTRVAQGIFVSVDTGRAFAEQETMGGSRGGWGSTG